MCTHERGRLMVASTGCVGAQKYSHSCMVQKHSEMCMQVKEEGWWLLLGDAGEHEVLAIKRMSFSERGTARLSFPRDGSPSGVRLHLISDSYLGLHQEHWVSLDGSACPTGACSYLLFTHVQQARAHTKT